MDIYFFNVCLFTYTSDVIIDRVWNEKIRNILESCSTVTPDVNFDRVGETRVIKYFEILYSDDTDTYLESCTVAPLVDGVDNINNLHAWVPPYRTNRKSQFSGNENGENM